MKVLAQKRRTYGTDSVFLSVLLEDLNSSYSETNTNLKKIACLKSINRKTIF